MRRLIALLPLPILLAACVEGDGPPEWEPDRPGSWYAGDFHVHSTGASNDTGGDSWPSKIAATARDRGLDFVVLTDHSNSTGSDPTTTDEDPALFNQGPEFTWWDSAGMLSDPGDFLLVVGNELSPGRTGGLPSSSRPGTSVAFPPTLDGFDTSVGVHRPPARRCEWRRRVAAGCRCRLPADPLPPIRRGSLDPGSIGPGKATKRSRIWNGTGGWDEFDEASRDIWICDLLAGRSVSAVGGSDNHRVHIGPPGSGTDPAPGLADHVRLRDEAGVAGDRGGCPRRPNDGP